MKTEGIICFLPFLAFACSEMAAAGYEILTSGCIVVDSESLAVSQSYLAADSGAIRATHCTAIFKPKEEAFHGSQRKSNP
jgi:hypothetical protein